VNDEFLHRLRQPPPAAFAARLRARLESQVVVRRFRRRQITLYSLIAALLGSTALALVVPTVRETAQTMLREMWPEPVPHSRVPPVQFPTRTQQSAQPPAVQAAGPLPQSAGSPATVAAANTPRNPAYERYGRSRARNEDSLIARGAPSVQMRTFIQIRLIGVAQTAAALQSAITEFQDLQGDVRVVTALTTNGWAFSRFCSGEGDVALSTRMITSMELEGCKRFGIELAVLPIAHEALAVVANSANGWVTVLRRTDLKTLFDPNVQKLPTWNQLDARWPATTVAVRTARPGVRFAESFSQLVFGTTPDSQPVPASQQLFESSHLLQRVQRNTYALTYVPYPAYLEFQPRAALRLLEIAGEDGLAVAPSRASIADGSYQLARPLLVFLKRRIDHTNVADDFIAHVLTTASERLAREGEYLPLSKAETSLAISILRTTGLPPFEPPGAIPLTAREVLLQQLPADRRLQERMKLESN
jgi:phosphate transport system substrate-binding protein